MSRYKSVMLAIAAGVLVPMLIHGSAQVSVAVKEARVREVPSFFGETIEVLTYGQQVRVLHDERGWKRIETSSGNIGWLHESAVTAGRVTFSAGDGDVRHGAGDEEVALAARGFTEQVESRYRTERGLDYEWVDRLEAQEAINPDDLREFLREGGLKVPEEDGR